jgi:hypothetical protein
LVEARLRPIARIPQARWDAGWQLCEATSQRWTFAIRVFPAVRELRAVS